MLKSPVPPFLDDDLSDVRFSHKQIVVLALFAKAFLQVASAVQGSSDQGSVLELYW